MAQMIQNWLDSTLAHLAGEAFPATAPASAKAPLDAVIITSADFPGDPATVMGVPPENLYVVRTAAGLVPPSQGQTDLSVAAALEYAVRVGHARNIILIAHDDCGIIRGLVDADAPAAAAMAQGQYLSAWMGVAAAAISGSIHGDDNAARTRHCAQELLRVGFENLMTYPWILDPVWSGRLGLHGWYIDRAAKKISVFSPETDSFGDV